MIKKKMFSYTFQAWHLYLIYAPFIISVFNLKLDYSFYISVGGGCLIYTLVGYLLHKYEIPKKYKLSIYILGIIGLLMQIIGTYTLSIHIGKIIDIYKGLNNLPTVLYSISIFVFKYD